MAASQDKKNNAGKKTSSSKGGIGTGGKVVIVLFAVLMALSLMLPSLSAIFSAVAGDSGSSSQSEQSGDSSGSDSSSDSSSSDASADGSSSSDSSASSGVAKYDEQYGALVDSLKSRYDSDPQNLATLLNLGKDYMAWGVYVRYYGSTDADTSHANELLANAVTYYDEYLALHDSNAVRVDRALCAYYSEDTGSALEQLKSVTEQSPDYGPAWANLGMLYEAQGDTDSAKSAYEKAQETDAYDEYGAKSYATQRINSLDSAASQSSSTGSSSSSSTGSTSTGVQGLSQTLGSLSGTGL